MQALLKVRELFSIEVGSAQSCLVGNRAKGKFSVKRLFRVRCSAFYVSRNTVVWFTVLLVSTVPRRLTVEVSGNVEALR